jgi:pterin-4a-carbinolamine dehydratase
MEGDDRMRDGEQDLSRVLGRQEASDAVFDLGWRYILGTLRTSVPVRSIASAAEVATRLVTVAGDDAGHLRIDLRDDGADVTLQSPAAAAVTRLDVLLAGRIAAALAQLGSRPGPRGPGAARDSGPRGPGAARYSGPRGPGAARDSGRRGASSGRRGFRPARGLQPTTGAKSGASAMSADCPARRARRPSSPA